MHASETFHYTVLERIRGYLELPANNAKFDDTFLIAHAAMPAMVEILSRLNNNADNRIYLRHNVDLVVGQEHYVLPPCIANVMKLAVMDSEGNVTADYYPGGINHPFGPGWSLEGNELALRPFPTEAMSVAVWYISNGDVRTHYSTTGEFNSSTVFDLGTPIIGKIDRRDQAYAGQVLRVITPTLIEERIISTYDASAGTVTVRRPFTEVYASASSSDDTFTYEIAPYGSQPLYEAIALRAAMKIGVFSNVSKQKRDNLKEEYRQAIKTIGDNLTNMQMRVPKHIDKATVDNDDWIQQFFGM